MRIVPLKIEHEDEVRDLLLSLGVTREGREILSPKVFSFAFKIEGIKSWEANIIKQHLLSLGTDAAINRDALVKNINTDILIFGSLSQLNKLCEKLKEQPFSLSEVSRTLTFYLNNLSKKEFLFKVRNKILEITQPVICGIINMTPDSFSGDGLLGIEIKGKREDLVLKKVEAMLGEGAAIIDVGGESSRPFSRSIEEKEEIKRVIPAIRTIRKRFKKIFISVDTYKYNVAKAAADEGVDIINDITALRASPGIAAIIKKYKLGCVIMHMKGMPQTMQMNPKYNNVSEEIISFLKERLDFCRNQGIKEEQIFIDPGIGFGKGLKDNFKIIKELYKFKIFGLPIFLGLSRKSFIGKTLNVKVDERLTGTIAASVISLIKGANILRVHDVKETAQAVKITSQILG